MSDKYVRDALQAVKGLRVTYTLYPVIGAGAAAGTTLVNAAAANTFGADTILIAAAAIAAEFWFCQLTVTACSVAENYVGSLEEAGATTIFEWRCSLTLVTPNVAPFQPPFPVWIAAGTQVTGRCASVSGADTMDVSILVATGL
jgi:hypothetical protein